MKRELRCIHNEAVYPEMGVVCELREPNSLCKDCKTFKPRYPSFSCQYCGEQIGWLGRIMEWLFGFIIHDCKYKSLSDVGKCTTCRFNNGKYDNCTVGSYYAEQGLNRICFAGELWEAIGSVDKPECNEQPEEDNGDFVPLVWMIEELRRREGGCIMNELVAEVKKNFKGIEKIKHRTINYH